MKGDDVMAKSEKISCTCCGDLKQEKEYYISKSSIYKANAHLPICKNCLGDIYDDYYRKFSDMQKSLYYMCRKVNICFSLVSYDAVLKELKNGKTTPVWKMYMTKLNSIGSKNGAGDDFDSSDEINEGKSSNGYVSEDKVLLSRWGKGFSFDELQRLEENYTEWLTHNDCDKLAVQKMVRLICIKELEIENAREQGKATDKLEKSLMELMNNSNLTPRTMSAINETDSTKIYGIWIRDIEQTKPAEYFKDKNIYSDYDGIKEYFDRFILRPMKNLLAGSRDFDKEFMIENDDEVGDN